MSKNRRPLRPNTNTLQDKLGSHRGIFFFLLALSSMINLLALTGSIYMLQIYDRALPSGSIPTLLAISLLVVGLYFFQGIFDVIRSQVFVRIGARLDERLAPIAHKVVIEMPRYGYSTAEALERGRDVDTIRSFLSSNGAIAFFDVPWMPIFLAFVYFLHPWLGLLALSGAGVMVLLTLITEFMTVRASKAMYKATVERNNLADVNARNADILKAMGMANRAINRFAETNSRHLLAQMKTSDISGTFGGFSKVLRMMLQSALLGMAAYLTMTGEVSAGSIIACSVAAARALAPVDQVIANWKNLAGARRSYARLKDTLATLDENETYTELPEPSNSFTAENVTIVAPGSGTVLVGDVSFSLAAGDGLGLIGPSGGGKTSLAKGLIGVWPLLRGHVRIDQADLSQWDPAVIGSHVGYLPQEIALLDGTIAENISRYEPDADDQKIIAAAQTAGIHEMIVRLPDGYQTQLGPHGNALSAGQRQRIGLARALYGDPFIVVLDEPNSNLDAEGEAALTAAIEKVRSRGGIVIVIAHRPSALAAVNLVGIVQGGRLASLGPKEEIFNAVAPQQQAAQPQASQTGTPIPRATSERARTLAKVSGQ